MVTRDERVRLIDGYNLEISDLEPQDAGDYVCQISDKINRDQVHTVEILGEFTVTNKLTQLTQLEIEIHKNVLNKFRCSLNSASQRARHTHIWPIAGAQGRPHYAGVQGLGQSGAIHLLDQEG